LKQGIRIETSIAASSSIIDIWRGSMTIVERTSVAVFGLLFACIFGVLLAWIVMAVAVGTGDKGKTASTEKKTGTSTEKIEILRARPVPITAPEPHFIRPHFMPIGRDDGRI
jgi:hypothetical protein